MVMNTLYDTGYNLTKVEELYIKDWKENQCPNLFFLVMSIWTAPYCWQTKFGTPYIVFN